MKLHYVKPEILEWLANRQHYDSPEDSWIDAIDNNHEDTSDDLSNTPVPSLDGIPDDFVFMWHCREVGMTWAAIAGMCSMTTAGCWKKYKRLAAETREKRGVSIRAVVHCPQVHKES